jgi:CPA2 family monovalent cation:H+ antiporter-2
MEAYSRWVGDIGGKSRGSPAARILTKLAWQIALNLLLATGVFIAVAVVHARYAKDWTQFPGGEEGVKAAFWLGALLVSFPCLIASWRKFQAGGMMVAELSVSPSKAGAATATARAVVSGTVFFAGSGSMVLWLLVLSSTLLPSRNVLLLAIAIAAVGGFLLYRASNRLYARAQYALHDTLAEPPEVDEHMLAKKVPSFLREARLEPVRLEPESPAAGRLIAELRLRTETGASIVGIQRGETSVVNPGPDEELLAGDDVLLIGSPEQLARARELFARPRV